MILKNFLLKSMPVLAVLFVLTAGFVMFNDLEASDSEDMNYCSQLWEICAQEAEYASNTCATYGANSSQCQDANADADEVCDNAADYCNDDE